MKAKTIIVSLIAASVLVSGIGIGGAILKGDGKNTNNIENFVELEDPTNIDFSKFSKEEQERLSAEANIPDKVFRMWLNEYLGKGGENYSPITVGELEYAEKDVIIANYGFQDITGIEYMKRVKRIDLTGNSFKTYEPLKELTGLHSLVLNGNHLNNDISFLSDMKDLRFIDLGDNEVNDISALAGLDKLESVYLYETQVVDISPLAGKTNLETLFLHETSVKDLSPLKEIPNLRNLALDGTKEVENLDSIKALTKIEELSITNVGIETIDFVKDMANLKLLYASHNKIKDISALSEKILLEELDLSYNEIEDINALIDSKNLEALDLSNNKIKSVEALKGKKKILHINLEDNQIAKWDTLQGAFPELTEFHGENNPAKVRQIEFYNGKPILKDVNSVDVVSTIKRITLYKGSETFEIEDKAVIKDVVSSLAKATEIGMVNVVSPEYNFNILYVDGTIQGVNIWFGEEGSEGTIMNKGNENMAYKLSVEDTNILRKHLAK